MHLIDYVVEVISVEETTAFGGVGVQIEIKEETILGRNVLHVFPNGKD